MKKFILLLLLLVGCAKSSDSTSAGTTPFISHYKASTLRPWVSTCNGTAKLEDKLWRIELGDGGYNETVITSNSCTIYSYGQYTYDVNSNILTLTQTFAQIVPSSCTDPVPNNYSRTGAVAQISPDQVTWAYTDSGSQTCNTIIRLGR